MQNKEGVPTPTGTVPYDEAIETYGETTGIMVKKDGKEVPFQIVGKQLVLLMEVGKYYQTSCDNGSPCYVKMLSGNQMLLAIESPLAVLVQHGLFTMAGAREIKRILFEKKMNEIVFELNTLKNTHA